MFLEFVSGRDWLQVLLFRVEPSIVFFEIVALILVTGTSWTNKISCDELNTVFKLLHSGDKYSIWPSWLGFNSEKFGSQLTLSIGLEVVIMHGAKKKNYIIKSGTCTLEIEFSIEGCKFCGYSCYLRESHFSFKW